MGGGGAPLEPGARGGSSTCACLYQDFCSTLTQIRVAPNAGGDQARRNKAKWNFFTNASPTIALVVSARRGDCSGRATTSTHRVGCECGAIHACDLARDRAEDGTVAVLPQPDGYTPGGRVIPRVHRKGGAKCSVL